MPIPLALLAFTLARPLAAFQAADAGGQPDIPAREVPAPVGALPAVEVSPQATSATAPDEPPLEVPPPDPHQAEALELCRQATDLLDRGARETAVIALDQAYAALLSLPAGEAFDQPRADVRAHIAEALARAYGRAPAAVAAPRPLDLSVPLVDNEHVKREIQSFTTGEREVFIEAYRRSGLYRPQILARLEALGLPSRLSWLPLVESAFQPRAFSSARAVGLWQFIASTGQRYGLKRDEWVDERMDPERSTEAALAFLADLHATFGDWPKALAAYNCGEACVARLQRRDDLDQDFWDLYQQLPLQTRRYVPRFIATLLIVETPDHYGLELPEPLPIPATATARVERVAELERLDAALGLDKGALRALNPELRQGTTPPHAHELRLPADRVDALPAALASLPVWKPPAPTAYRTHRVASGENLGAIAQRYATTVRAILAANDIGDVRRLQIGQLLRIPAAGAR